MTLCLIRYFVVICCLTSFVSNALVATQKVEKTKNKWTGIELDANHSTSYERQENISSPKLRFHQKSLLFHLLPPSDFSKLYNSKDLIFQSLKMTGKIKSDNSRNHLTALLSRGNDLTKLSVSANIQGGVIHSCLKFKKSIYRKQCYFVLSQYYLKDIHSKFKQINTLKQFDVYNSINFRNRRLLSGSIQMKQNLDNVPKLRQRKRKSWKESATKSRTNIKQRTVSVPLNNSGNASNTSNVNLEKLALKELKEYEEFVSMMEQTFSKDPLRAMLSVAFLMIVLMLAIKFCGMKPVKQERENLDFHENVHYVNIHDILKRKRPYLPKSLLTWERRLRRKFKRRQRIRRVREQEQAENVISDNSEEEMLIYGGNCDF